MNYPKYLTVDHYLKLKDFEKITNASDLVKVINVITGLEEDEIKKLSKDDIDTLTDFVKNLLDNSVPKFWPVFEHKGITYGFNPISKMILGEWIDMDALSKDWQNNLHLLTATVYRPITKHNYKSWIWRTHYNIKVLTKDNTTSPFDVYEVEPYNADTVAERAELFKELPLEIAKGMLSFFLVFAVKHSETIQTSLLQTQEEKNIVIEGNQNLIQQLYQTTTVGS